MPEYSTSLAKLRQDELLHEAAEARCASIYRRQIRAARANAPARRRFWLIPVPSFGR